MLLCEHCGQRHNEVHRYCPVTGKLLAPQRFFPPGTLLDGKYRIGEALGAGGVGAVFAVTHMLLDKRMAVKVMLPELSQDREMAARMAREAQAASATGHPNVATVTDMGWSDQGSMYIVMELLSGRTLTEVIRDESPLPPPRAAELTCQLLAGLEAVHGRGIVHRDIKPDNLMVIELDQQPQLKILDFGISKFLQDDELRQSLTSTGIVLGTPYYMSPEQARGDPDLDHRADIYAVGGVLYSLLTGRRPLTAADHASMLTAILEATIEAPSKHVPGIPPELDALVLKALARQPAERFEDADAMRRALETIVAEADVATIVDREPPVHMRPAGKTAADDEPSLLSLVDIDKRAAAPQPAESMPAASTPPAAPVIEEQAPTADDDPRFAPPDEAREGPLELERAALPPQLPTGIGPQGVELGEEAEGDGTLHDPDAQRRRGALRQGRALLATAGAVALLLLSGLLLGPVVCGWLSDDEAIPISSPGTSASDYVLILIETVPKGATIYVDGVQQVSGSIQLPRSGQTFSVRVTKRGYVSQAFELTAGETRAIRVELRRKPGRYE